MSKLLPNFHCFISLWFTFVLAFLLELSSSAHFSNRGSGGDVIDRPLLCRLYVTPLPPPPLPGWQMGFLGQNTPSPFLSPRIGERERERVRWDSSQSNTSRDKWRWRVQKVYSERPFRFLCLLVHHTPVNTNLTLGSISLRGPVKLAGRSLWFKTQNRGINSTEAATSAANATPRFV